MGKGRLEAFTDAVMAIIITIMVLELKLPKGGQLSDLASIWQTLLSYVLSFVYLAIYWNNHHHMMHAATQVNGNVLWKNIHLLFWLSLIPFATRWMGENNFTLWPVVFYGALLFMCGNAYYLLAHGLATLHGKDSAFSIAIGRDWKGIISTLIYVIGIGLCFIHPLIGFTCYVLVAGIWFIPDKRFEKT